MPLTALYKTPFPYYGGKADAAPTVWDAFGDPHHYVEPFAGSLAVLLRRPHPCNRPYFSETVNDANGLLCNVWRALQWSPDATADAASWPTCEADLTARHLALVRWCADQELEHLMGDPRWHDPRIAGWWIWGMSNWIGSGWCTGTGPWTADAEGRLWKQPPGTREPGVSRRRPHLSKNGQGAQRPSTRHPGVARQLPHMGDDGRGVQHGAQREPGVKRVLPPLNNNGQGVQHASAREPGVLNALSEFHPMTMPEIRRWFDFLSARLRHVRIVNGDWSRVMTPAVLQTLPVRHGQGVCGLFLDPPYALTTGRERGLYAHDDAGSVATAVRDWCLAQGDNPQYRIALAGFGTEHAALEAVGWRCVEWFTEGFLKGGMGTQQAQERLWLSPYCVQPLDAAQGSLF